jgi:hypothetical protein
MFRSTLQMYGELIVGVRKVVQGVENYHSISFYNLIYIYIYFPIQTLIRIYLTYPPGYSTVSSNGVIVENLSVMQAWRYSYKPRY